MSEQTFFSSQVKYSVMISNNLVRKGSLTTSQRTYLINTFRIFSLRSKFIIESLSNLV